MEENRDTKQNLGTKSKFEGLHLGHNHISPTNFGKPKLLIYSLKIRNLRLEFFLPKLMIDYILDWITSYFT